MDGRALQLARGVAERASLAELREWLDKWERVRAGWVSIHTQWPSQVTAGALAEISAVIDVLECQRDRLELAEYREYEQAEAAYRAYNGEV